MAAGRHLLLDFYNCRDGLTVESIEQVLVEASKATGARVLFAHSHLFEDGGCSGVTVLAESHASYHYWWEEKFMALDVFVCGDCDPFLAVDVLCEAFAPEVYCMKMQQRGEYMGKPFMQPVGHEWRKPLTPAATPSIEPNS